VVGWGKVLSSRAAQHTCWTHRRERGKRENLPPTTTYLLLYTYTSEHTLAHTHIFETETPGFFPKDPGKN